MASRLNLPPPGDHFRRQLFSILPAHTRCDKYTTEDHGVCLQAYPASCASCLCVHMRKRISPHGSDRMLTRAGSKHPSRQLHLHRSQPTRDGPVSLFCLSSRLNSHKALSNRLLHRLEMVHPPIHEGWTRRLRMWAMIGMVQEESPRARTAKTQDDVMKHSATVSQDVSYTPAAARNT